MQDQGKRLLLAVGLALVVLLVWQVLFPAKKPEEPPPGVGSSALVAPKPPVKKPSTVTTQRGPEATITLAFPKFSATFSSYGGVLKSWKLADTRYERDSTGGELLAPKRADAGAFAIDFAN